MSYTQRLLKPSYQVQDPNADIECKQATCGLFGVSNKHVAIRIQHAEPGLQLCSSAHQSRHLSEVCYIIKGSRSNGCGANRLDYCKHRRSVRVKIGCAANMPIP